jgi:alpha-glucosidase
VVEVDADALTLSRGELTVVLNCGTTPVPMPAGELLIASAPVDNTVPPDTAVWLRSR